MTADPGPETLSVWAICLRAGEGARRRGDRRYGADHLLAALLDDPSIGAALGPTLSQARRAIESLDRRAPGAAGGVART